VKAFLHYKSCLKKLAVVDSMKARSDVVHISALKQYRFVQDSVKAHNGPVFSIFVAYKKVKGVQ